MFRVIFKPFKIRACLKYSYSSNTANFEVRYFTLYLLYKVPFERDTSEESKIFHSQLFVAELKSMG